MAIIDKSFPEISIHALVKRATSPIAVSQPYKGISIHALVKRATVILGLDFVKKNYFNPRPREEGDRRVIATYMADFISIHALVKRATKSRYTSFCNGGNFNPRPREEGDQIHLVNIHFLLFQSTPS